MKKSIRKPVSAVLALVMLLSAFAALQTFPAAQAADDSRYLAYYADVIQAYKTLIKNNCYRDGSWPAEIPEYVSSSLIYNKSGSDNSNVYYALYDVNGNGFPELLIGEHIDEDYLYGVYTYTNKAQMVTEEIGSYIKAAGTLFKSGTIVESVRDGWAGHTWTLYRLDSKDRCKCAAKIVYDGWNGERYFRDEGLKQEMTKRQAQQLFKKYTGQSDFYDYKSDVKLNWKRINDLPEITGLAAPSGLKVSSANTTALNLRWNKVKGAKGYQVFRYDAAAKKYVRVAVTRKNVVKITDLTPGTSYRFVVRAYSKAGGKYLYSGYSGALNAKTRA